MDRLTHRRTRSRSSARHPRGLAALELVLWLPVLLFVTALMVNVGTSQAWRIRGEVAARDAAWQSRWPRTASPRPPVAIWPKDAGWGNGGAASNLPPLQHQAVQHEVIRGSLAPVDVKPILHYDQGEVAGSASISRPFPMLPKLGNFDSGQIASELLTNEFQIGTMVWEDGRGETHYVPWNVFRRIKVLYVLQEQKPAFAQEFLRALMGLFNMRNFGALWVLDHDPEIRHYQGGYADFHPQVRPRCELNPLVVRKEEIERLIDHRRPDGKVELGEISLIPRNMTNYFLSMYRNEIQELQDQIDQLRASGGPGAQSQINAAQAEIDSIRPKIDQLEDYQQRLPGLEQQMLMAAQARL